MSLWLNDPPSEFFWLFSAKSAEDDDLATDKVFSVENVIYQGRRPYGDKSLVAVIKIGNKVILINLELSIWGSFYTAGLSESYYIIIFVFCLYFVMFFDKKKSIRTK